MPGTASENAKDHLGRPEGARRALLSKNDCEGVAELKAGRSYSNPPCPIWTRHDVPAVCGWPTHARHLSGLSSHTIFSPFASYTCTSRRKADLTYAHTLVIPFLAMWSSSRCHLASQSSSQAYLVSLQLLYLIQNPKQRTLEPRLACNT